jgi:hypothetical protein
MEYPYWCLYYTGDLIESVMLMKSTTFWIVMLCTCNSKRALRFEGIRLLHFELGLLPASADFLTYSSTLRMKAIYSSETSVDIHMTTLCYISEDRTLHNHRYENLQFNED